MLDKVAVITLYVEDRERSATFYERVFEREPDHVDDTATLFKLDGIFLRLVPGSGGPAPRAQLGTFVADADAMAAELAARGVELHEPPADQPWGMRTASFLDPDGYVWGFGAEIGAEN